MSEPRQDNPIGAVLGVLVGLAVIYLWLAAGCDTLPLVQFGN